MTAQMGAVLAYDLECGAASGDVVATGRGRPAARVRDPLTERTRAIWSTGNYDRISAGFRDEAERFVSRLRLARGQNVLDAACGSGNLTIPAAQSGAHVTGFDLIPELLAVAAGRAARESLAIKFDSGSVEHLPYGDGQFDVVMSMFGVMFAGRPECVVSELTRVTRPGGRVALANWTRDGFVGKMLAAHTAHLPPPPGLKSPLQWGDEAVIRDWFDARTWKVTTTPRTLVFHYPFAPAGTAELFRAEYGPTVRTFEALREDERAKLAADLTSLWTQHQQPWAPTTEVASEYLEVIAVRR